MHSSAFSIDYLDKTTSLISASDVSEMSKYKDLIDLSRWYLAFCPTNSISDMFKLSLIMRDFVKKRNSDLVHNTTYSKELFFLFPFLSSIPARLMTVHDPIPHDTISRIERLRMGIYQKFFKNRLLLSDALLEDYLKFSGFNRNTIYFSRLSVYDFLTSYEVQRNDIGNYILFFGRITYYKGVELLIEAFKNSQLWKQGIKLVIAGKGGLNCETPSQDDGIIFLNRYIENIELANLIRWSMYVVLPYRSATQSGCVMSAYAFNKPILATRVGDLPKEIEHNKTGFIIDPNSVECLQKGLIQLSNNVFLDKLSHNIESKYKSGSKYSWYNIAKGLESIYSKIL